MLRTPPHLPPGSSVSLQLIFCFFEGGGYCNYSVIVMLHAVIAGKKKENNPQFSTLEVILTCSCVNWYKCTTSAQ